MPNIISKLQVTKKDSNEKEFIPIGAYSDNVIISDSNRKFSLTQLYDYLKTFFNKRMFSWYDYKLPDDSSKIIEFYQIDNNND